MTNTKVLLDALKEAKETIEWMNENKTGNWPERNDRSFTEHYGNAYMNTMYAIDAALASYTDASEISPSHIEQLKTLNDQILIDDYARHRWIAEAKGVIAGILMEAGKQPEQQPADPWIPVNHPPKEGGRYWCIVEEVNDLGVSTFQWNCYYDLQKNEWRDNLETVKVTHYTSLLPFPRSVQTEVSGEQKGGEA